MSEPVLQIENLTKRFGALIANDAVDPGSGCMANCMP